jgi:flagellar motility protein MotE (MotC chaperone)
MNRYVRDLRLVPIALIASACLLALKTADIVLDSGYFFATGNSPAGDAGASVIRTTPDMPEASGTKLSWAQQMFNFPDGANTASLPAVRRPPVDRFNAEIITGSVTPPAADGKSETAAKNDPAGPPGKDAKSAKPALPPNGTVIPTDGAALPSGAERAILERLQQRREELDARARELDIRESLIKAAEKRMDGRLTELKEVEARIKVETGQKNEAELARFKGLVTMYESMKPRDAAKIFNGLEIGVLLKVASQINPRQMSEILAQMSPDMAERLTVELANRAAEQQHTDKPASAADLPKIEGQPTTP